MKKKIFLTAALIVSLIPMIANQYGFARGVDEVSGLINIWNPIGIVAIIIYLLGVWLPLRNTKTNKIIGLFGLIGIIIAEIYTFLTWHGLGFNLAKSFEGAFPEFYLGLITSILMIVIYFCTYSCVETGKATHSKGNIATPATAKKTGRRSKK